MNEIFLTIFYNISIILITLLALWLFLKYRNKKHRERIVSMFEESHAKFATNNQAKMQFEKRKREWERKHQVKALKQRIKRFFYSQKNENP